MISLRAKTYIIVGLAAAIFVSFMGYSYVTRNFYFAERILSPGESTLDYLRGQPYSRLLVEVDHVRGRQPSAFALDVLRERLLRYTDKREVIFVTSEELTEGRGNYSIQGLIDLYRQHHNHATGGDTAVVYVVYVNGVPLENREADGVAYTSRSMAVFRDQYAAPFADAGSRTSEEATVLVHEMGHLLGLVNLVYQSDQKTLHNSPIPYEDKDHPGHTMNTSDVMYYASEAPGPGSVPPLNFGWETAHDLEGLKSGRLRLAPPSSEVIISSTDMLISLDGVGARELVPWPRVSS